MFKAELLNFIVSVSHLGFFLECRLGGKGMKLCILSMFPSVAGFPGGAGDKELTCQCKRHKRCRFNPWVGKILWRRAWQPILYSCLENPMDGGSLSGYSPWDHKASDTTEVT